MDVDVRGELDGADANKRLGAARKICRVARADWTSDRKAWLTDNHTIRSLLGALEDSDPRVREQVVIALGAINSRYEALGSHVHDALCRMFASQPDSVRLAICQAIAGFETEQGWRVVRACLECRPPRKASWAVGLAVSRHGGSIGKSSRCEWAKVLVERCFSEKSIDSASVLLGGIERLGCIDVIERIEELATQVENRVLLDDIECTLETLRKAQVSTNG